MQTLSDLERTLIGDAEIIRAKNSIVEKVNLIFGNLADAYRKILEEQHVTLPFNVPPKISKGEKYEGLPYLVLDFPRYFSSQEVFAIRTLFWWGNYFSITLQLQGQYQQQFAPLLVEAIHSNKLEEWLLQKDGDMWQHAINENYVSVTSNNCDGIETASFIKLTKKIPLNQWDQIENLLIEDFTKLVQILYAPIL